MSFHAIRNKKRQKIKPPSANFEVKKCLIYESLEIHTGHSTYFIMNELFTVVTDYVQVKSFVPKNCNTSHQTKK